MLDIPSSSDLSHNKSMPFSTKAYSTINVASFYTTVTLSGIPPQLPTHIIFPNMLLTTLYGYPYQLLTPVQLFPTVLADLTQISGQTFPINKSRNHFSRNTHKHTDTPTYNYQKLFAFTYNKAVV